MTAYDKPELLYTADIVYDVPDLEPGEAIPIAPARAPADLKIHWHSPMPILPDRADLEIPLSQMHQFEWVT